MANGGLATRRIPLWLYAALPVLLAPPVATWFLWLRYVNETVEQPYLDEFFHIPQAQIYCKGVDRWHQWDPKITTPPGLYILAWLANKCGLLSCDTPSLRSLNANVWPVAGLAVFAIFVALRQLKLEQGRELLQALHTAVNVCLFPPIWFFTGLFYTDVASTVFVLVTLAVFYNRSWVPSSGLLVFLLGAVSLLFRQTNIFWVAVFPAGVVFLSEMQKLGRLSHEKVGGACAGDYILTSYRLIKSFIGLLFTRPTFLLHLAMVLWPQASLLALFAGFIAWNGGVVLGDKSNHVATIHLPQMLYLFAYMAFFSLPLILPAICCAIIPRKFSRHFQFLDPYRDQFEPWSKTETWLKLPTDNYPILSIVFLVCFALPAIHYNTIIHPFTLADNRHYVFYVFRVLRLYPWLRYAAAPVYLFCIWLTVAQLGVGPMLTERERQRVTVYNGMRGGYKTAPMDSFVLVWMATCALCLITAPLVEPRYFILPWIVWRLQVQSPDMTAAGEEEWQKRQASGLSRLWVLYHGDYRLYAETAWFILINGSTAYIFLNWGFEWPQEPGIVQRFLW